MTLWLRIRLHTGATAAYGPWSSDLRRQRAARSWRADPAVAAVTLHDATPSADHHHDVVERSPRRDLGRARPMATPVDETVAPPGFWFWRGTLRPIAAPYNPPRGGRRR
jgi:hypothetical protein